MLLYWSIVINYMCGFLGIYYFWEESKSCIYIGHIPDIIPFENWIRAFTWKHYTCYFSAMVFFNVIISHVVGGGNHYPSYPSIFLILHPIPEVNIYRPCRSSCWQRSYGFCWFCETLWFLPKEKKKKTVESLLKLSGFTWSDSSADRQVL